MKRILVFVVMLLMVHTTNEVLAQVDFKKDTVKVWLLQPHLALQFPMGDMKQRFYPNGAFGFGALYKTKSNWLFGAEFSYLFAEKVRNEGEILSNITTSEGYVIDQTGVFANIYFRERGFFAGVKGGHVFPTRFGNPNSGILLMGSFGVLQHKIRIEVHENTAPQLTDDYKKGYDKLTNGPAGSLYIGYLHFSNNHLSNFSIGIEYLYASTISRRDYDYILMGKDETVRRDQMLSIRFGWLIPTYARAPKDFYFN